MFIFCTHFFLSPWGRQKSKLAPNIPGPYVYPMNNPLSLHMGGPCEYDGASQSWVQIYLRFHMGGPGQIR